MCLPYKNKSNIQAHFKVSFFIWEQDKILK